MWPCDGLLAAYQTLSSTELLSSKYNPSNKTKRYRLRNANHFDETEYTHHQREEGSVTETHFVMMP
jgi:hypothetical protein